MCVVLGHQVMVISYRTNRKWIQRFFFKSHGSLSEAAQRGLDTVISGSTVQFSCLNQTNFYCISHLSYILSPFLKCPFSFFPFKNVPLESCTEWHSLRQTLLAPMCTNCRSLPDPAQSWGCWHVLPVLNPPAMHSRSLCYVLQWTRSYLKVRLQ